MNGLDKIVADYVDRFQGRAERELRFFAILRTFEDAVSLAALAQGPGGKRLSHQRRIQVSSLRESRRFLLESLPLLQQAHTFEHLYEIVASRLGPIPGIGELTIYDTTLRIGAKLHLEPSLIYLHAGTRVGARKLGLDFSRDTLTVLEVPGALRKLRPREIEDILCIYKDRFGKYQRMG